MKEIELSQGKTAIVDNVIYCIICGKPLIKGAGTVKLKHVHESCREAMQKVKTRYCWKCGIKLTKKNRKGRACLCLKCHAERYWKPRVKHTINSKKALLDEAEKLLKETPFLAPETVYNTLYSKRGNGLEFNKRSLRMRMRGDRMHRFKLENGLWSLRTPEMRLEVENEMAKAKGMI